MDRIIDYKTCTGCGGCYSICPKHCIKMVEDIEGFLYPHIDEEKCIKCGLCDHVCPVKREEPKRINKPKTYAVMIKNENLRLKSSSGGVFPLMAGFILDNNGVVYGAAMSDDCKSVQHIRVDNKDDLYKLMGSKYLQSNINDVYKKIKLDLIDGKEVLFSGTPCQVDGLKLFLDKDYSNLLSVEVICHGVPSPLLWKKYCEYLENRFSAKIESVNFREKRNGRKSFGLYEDGVNISQYLSASEDPYMSMFLRNYSLRPSCYQCKAKELESMADITIADFWGIDDVAPDISDDKGTSLVLLQSEKGNVFFDVLRNKCLYKQVNFLQGVKYNHSYNQSVAKPNERDVFFRDVNQLEFGNLTKKYCGNKKKVVTIKFLVKKLVKYLICRGGVSHTKFEYGLLICLNNERKK